ncbi:hypothetical protein FRC03_006300 [Tulasnella sp. 419]|nr:hypothetical protein FRC03_006300 [Tulasnella sp. 419]
MSSDTAYAFCMAVQCIAKQDALKQCTTSDKHSKKTKFSATADNQVLIASTRDYSDKISCLNKMKIYAAKKVGGCRRTNRSKTRSLDSPPTQGNFKSHSHVPQNTHAPGNASIKCTALHESFCEITDAARNRGIEDPTPSLSPESPADAVLDIKEASAHVLETLEAEKPLVSDAGEEIHLDSKSGQGAIPLTVEEQIELIGRRYPLKEKIDPNCIAPLRPRDPSSPPQKRYRIRQDKVFGAAPVRHLRAKRRAVVEKENEVPMVSSSSPAQSFSPESTEDCDEVVDSPNPPSCEDIPTSPSLVDSADSDHSNDPSSPTVSVATPIAENVSLSIEEVSFLDGAEASGMTSSEDVPLLHPEVTNKIDMPSDKEMSISATTVDPEVFSEDAQESSPADALTSASDQELELDEDLIERAENAQLVRAGRAIMSKSERATKLKEELKRQACLQVDVGEAMEDNILTEAPAKPDYYRRSTNPRRINGVYYHGHPRVVRGWLANLPFAPYSAPAPRRGFVWQDQLHPLDLSENLDDVETRNEATNVDPAAAATSSESAARWWNVPAMLQKAGAALRVF